MVEAKVANVEEAIREYELAETAPVSKSGVVVEFAAAPPYDDAVNGKVAEIAPHAMVPPELVVRALVPAQAPKFPSVVEPMLEIENRVVVEKVEVVEAIAKRVCGLPRPLVDVATIETIAYGDVVPMPKEPVVVFHTNWLVPALPNCTVEDA